MKMSRKAEFAKTAESIAMANSKPMNIHKEALPKYVPQRIQDNVEACYFTKEQFGWCPMDNVDPQVRDRADQSGVPTQVLQREEDDVASASDISLHSMRTLEKGKSRTGDGVSVTFETKVGDTVVIDIGRGPK